MWTGQKDFWATYWVAKSSPRDICFFWVVSLTESPKIMGLKGIHSPEALKWLADLSFCPWCGKGAEWGHGDESLKDKSLLPGPHLWPVLGVFHNQCRHNAPSHAAVPDSNCPWQWQWQLWRRLGCCKWQRWQWLHIYLGLLRMQISLHPHVHTRVGFSSQPPVILPILSFNATCNSTTVG